jgi:hypothetical protein
MALVCVIRFGVWTILIVALGVTIVPFFGYRFASVVLASRSVDTVTHFTSVVVWHSCVGALTASRAIPTKLSYIQSEFRDGLNSVFFNFCLR